MIRNDMDDISDYDFNNVIMPCEKKIYDFVKNNFLNEYVAYHISICFRNNAMWNQPFDVQVNTALDDLSQFNKEDCNYSKIKEILEKKYKLKVVCDSPIDIKDLKD